MRVTVVGAGIIGTTTAYRLKRRYPDLQLRILAEKLSPHTTSDIGIFRAKASNFSVSAPTEQRQKFAAECGGAIFLYWHIDEKIISMKERQIRC